MKNRMTGVLAHPLVLFVYLLGGILVSMMTMHPVLLGVSFCLSSLGAFLLWGRMMWKRLFGMILPVLLFLAVLLPLFSHRGETPLFYVNGLAVTKESVCCGIVMSLLLAAVFQWFQMANYLLDSEKLLYLCGRIFPSLGLLFSMVFRMIPLMGERMGQIKDAQRGMGRKSENLSLPGKISLLLKEISVLISWSLESSMEMAVSMENRGYGVGKPTFFTLFSFGGREIFSVILLMVLYGLCLINIAGGSYAVSFFPKMQFEQITGRGILGILCFGIAALLPMIEQSHE
jgi:energy-coupling factor transport system permease protein